MATLLTTGKVFSTGEQVTAQKLNDAVGLAKFVSGTNGSTDGSTLDVNGSYQIYVRDTGITEAKLASNSVTTAKIADATITPAKLSTYAPTWSSTATSIANSLDFSAISTTATSGTYGRSGTTVTISMTGHGMTTGMVATFTFNSDGSGNAATGGTYVVTVSDANTFTITDTVSGTITGNPACSRSSYYGTSTIRGSQTVAGNLTVSKNTTLSGDATISGALTVAGTAYHPITRATSQATTTGKYVDFTSIPSWVKKVSIIFNGVSTNGGDEYLIQIGDSGGLETTGYVSEAGDRVGEATSTAGYVLTYSNTATNTTYGVVTIYNITGNTWVSSGTLSITNLLEMSAGSKTLSDVLDRVRITTTGGANDFDAGSVNIIYE